MSKTPSLPGMDAKTLTINGREYACPFADLLPRLTTEERAELRADIEANGVQVAVVVSTDDEMIDGHNRAEIAAELGKRVPVEVKRYADNDAKQKAAKNLNFNRRHLSRKKKRDWIASLLKANPDRSNLSVAKEAGVTDKTVERQRREMEQRSEIPNAGKRTDAAGRKQAARKSKRAVKVETAGDKLAKCLAVMRKLFKELEAEHTRARVRKAAKDCGVPVWEDENGLRCEWIDNVAHMITQLESKS